MANPKTRPDGFLGDGFQATANVGDVEIANRLFETGPIVLLHDVLHPFLLTKFRCCERPLDRPI